MENTNSNLPANILNMATALAQSAAQAGANSGMDAFMKFSKFGEWIYGAENVEVEEGSVWAVNPLGFQHGWTAWGTKAHGTDGQNVGEVMVPSTQPMPLEENLPVVKGEWSKAVGIQMRCTNGEDEGVQVMFKTNSYGGRKAYAALLQAVVARITSGATECMPLVALKADSYQHKTYGKIFNPIIEVVGWASHTDEKPAPATATVDRLPPHAEPPNVEEPPKEVVQEETPRRRRRRVE
jgi:hypothetical protein